MTAGQGARQGEATAAARGRRKERTGVVVSRSGDKTIVVAAPRRVRHPVYGKELRHKAKFHAHDEENRARVGDRVRIVETRPLSRLKRWRLAEVVWAAPSPAGPSEESVGEQAGGEAEEAGGS